MWLCYLSVAHKGGYHTAFAYRALMLYPQWWIAVPRLSTVCSLMSCSCPFVQKINSNCLSPQDEDYILGWGHGQRQLQSPWTRSHSCYCSLKSTWRTYIWSLCGWVLTVVEISRHHLMRKIYVPQAHWQSHTCKNDWSCRWLCHFCHLLHAVRSSNGCISVHRTKQGCCFLLLIHHAEDRRTQLID